MSLFTYVSAYYSVSEVLLPQPLLLPPCRFGEIGWLSYSLSALALHKLDKLLSDKCYFAANTGYANLVIQQWALRLAHRDSN